MFILFDQGTPAPLRKHLLTHQVATAYEPGWATLRNGELLTKAEEEGFEVIVTTDQNLKYQQNLVNRRIAIVVLPTTSWPRIQKIIPEVCHTISSATLNDYIEVSVPGCS
ncbi:MAG: hypothetical protein AAF669_00390 [Pseudomonadota bacterium]